MADLVYLDTHVIAWLYTEGGQSIPAAARKEIERCNSLLISPMVRSELQYLYEIGRVSQTPQPVLDELASYVGLSICQAPFSAVVRAAEQLSWTRDPFDRLIVAQASLSDSLLITKDAVIRANYTHGLWA